MSSSIYGSSLVHAQADYLIGFSEAMMYLVELDCAASVFVLFASHVRPRYSTS